MGEFVRTARPRAHHARDNHVLYVVTAGSPVCRARAIAGLRIVHQIAVGLKGAIVASVRVARVCLKANIRAGVRVIINHLAEYEFRTKSSLQSVQRQNVPGPIATLGKRYVGVPKSVSRMREAVSLHPINYEALSRRNRRVGVTIKIPVTTLREPLARKNQDRR